MDHIATDSSAEIVTGRSKETRHFFLVEIDCKSIDLAKELKDLSKNTSLPSLSLIELKDEILKVLCNTEHSFRELQNYFDCNGKEHISLNPCDQRQTIFM